MSTEAVDLTLCDREPIHIPGSVQPHGLMLVVDPESLSVTHAAGNVATRLGRADLAGASLEDLLGKDAAAEARHVAETRQRGALELVAPPLAMESFEAQLHLAGTRLIVELEPKPEDPLRPAPAAARGCGGRLRAYAEPAAALRCRGDRLPAAHGLRPRDAHRFLDDDAGVVMAEDCASGQKGFLNHHFPATDIPKQARALYVRNLVRLIPDVKYRPAPLVPAWTEAEPLDMSDAVLRSVSPVHLQYLKNMGVATSGSFSIVKDGALWGLVACHNSTPKLIRADVRAACRALAGGLSRQIKAREETDAYRERVRLRSFEDDIVALLLREGSLDNAISNHLGEIMRMLDGDGVAVLRGGDLVVDGRCPAKEEVRKIAGWAVGMSSESVFATDRLANSTRFRTINAPSLPASSRSPFQRPSRGSCVAPGRTGRGREWAGNPTSPRPWARQVSLRLARASRRGANGAGACAAVDHPGDRSCRPPSPCRGGRVADPADPGAQSSAADHAR